MKNSKTGRIFVKGLLFALPILLTFAILTWAISGADAMLAKPVKAILPSTFYFPGAGLIVALGLIYLIGLAIHGRIMSFLFQWLQSAMAKLPVVNVIYQNLKEMIDFASGAKDADLERVVMVTLDGDLRLMGFVTKQEVEFPEIDEDALRAVYLPMSYQMGGYLVYLPESRLESLDITKQEAMQRILTADISKAVSPDEAVNAQ